MKSNNRNMNIYRLLVCVAIVLIQVIGANAQFGDLGNLVNKKLKKQKQASADDSDATPTTQPSAAQPATTTDTSGGNTANDSGKVNSALKTATSLPPIYDVARQCDEVRFAELLKKDIHLSIRRYLNF